MGRAARRSPAFSIAQGQVRDLSGVIAISRPTVSRRPRSTACASSIPRRCRWSRERRASGLASRRCRSSSASASITASMRDETNSPYPEGADPLPQGDQLDQRSQRRCRLAQGLRRRAIGRSSSASSSAARRAMSPRADWHKHRRRLLPRQRRVRARTSRSSAAANGPRARAATRSVRWARGWSPRTRCPIPRRSICAAK